MDFTGLSEVMGSLTGVGDVVTGSPVGVGDAILITCGACLLGAEIGEHGVLTLKNVHRWLDRRW